MKKLATLKNIADRVGVNPATVSRALAPGKKQLISKEVREKIEKAAAKLNYRPRISGRSLATNKSMCIGLVLHNLAMDFGSPFFSILLSAFILRLGREGYSVQILPVANDKTREDEILNYLYSGRVDGFLIGQALINNKVLDEFILRQMPVVLLDEDQKIKHELPRLRINERSGADEAVRTLIVKGATKIAYRHHDYIYTSPYRVTAFEDAWEQQTSKKIEKIIYRPKVRGILSDRPESYKEAIRNIKELKKYDAIACCTDLSALGVMDALADNGIRPGKDILIVGYDNIEANPNYPTEKPVLSTIDKMRKETGIKAAEMLLGQLGAGVSSDMVTELSTKFIKRSSTGE